MREWFFDIMTNPMHRVHVSVAGLKDPLDSPAWILRSALSDSPYRASLRSPIEEHIFDWELYMIFMNPQWRDQIVFWDWSEDIQDWIQVPNPFLPYDEALKKVLEKVANLP